MVALEACEYQNKVKWVEDLKDGLGKFGWSREVVDRLEGVSLGEVECMLRDSEWCEVKKACMDDGS